MLLRPLGQLLLYPRPREVRRIVAPEVYVTEIVPGDTDDVQIAVAVEVDSTRTQMAFLAAIDEVFAEVARAIIDPDREPLLAAVLTQNQVEIAVAIHIGHIHTVGRRLRRHEMSGPIGACGISRVLPPVSLRSAVGTVFLGNDDVEAAVTI